MNNRKKFTLEEKTQIYTEYFNHVMKTFVPEPGEEIRQCLDDSLGRRYFNPRWAVSNTGKIYSIRKSGLTLLSPWLCGTRYNQFQIMNTFHGCKLRVRTSRLQAVYWCDRSVMEQDPDHPILSGMAADEAEQIFSKHWEVHHQIPVDSEKPYWENDRSDNLQFISKANHHQLTQLQCHVGSLARPWNDSAQTILSSSKDAIIMLQSVTGLPDDVEPKELENIFIFSSIKGTDPLKSLRNLFGDQVEIKYELYPLNSVKLSFQ